MKISLELFSLLVIAVLLIALLLVDHLPWLKARPRVQEILMAVEALVAIGAILQYAGWLF